MRRFRKVALGALSWPRAAGLRGVQGRVRFTRNSKWEGAEEMIACFDATGTLVVSCHETPEVAAGEQESHDKPAEEGDAKPIRRSGAQSARPSPDGPNSERPNSEGPNSERSRVTVRAGSIGPVRIESRDRGDRFALGAPSVVPADAPDPAEHPAGKSDAEIRELLASKSRRREDGIRRVLEEGKAKGQDIERFVAAITYDSELAPKTTNRRQLLELGITVPSPDSLPKDDAEARRALWTIVYGLARLGIFLTGTDALDDRTLLARLTGRVLLDEVADIPPSADMSEFIDMSVPDGLTGPFEASLEADDDADDPLHEQSDGPYDRDRILPRPDRA
jgi:hypothetical protein